MTRRGFTIAELVIAMVVMAILGTALARILIDNSRFVSRQDAMMESRATARAAMQAMVAELHMVPDSGLLAAAGDSVTVTVPYAFGMTCLPTSGTATVVRVAAAEGAEVRQGDVLLTLEAMKMQWPLRAPHDGTVRRVLCREGEIVPAGTALVEM